MAREATRVMRASEWQPSLATEPQMRATTGVATTLSRSRNFGRYGSLAPRCYRGLFWT
jgi:hypothetical protein